MTRPPDNAPETTGHAARPAPAPAPAPDDRADECLEASLDEAEGGPDLDIGPEDGAAPASLRRGASVIRAQLRHAPAGPGVYRMIAADGEVLYVGKAKSVRKRIASYVRLSGHTNRIARMIGLTASMVFVSTATETEALLLETNFIKQMKPRFNVLMRDDKSFPYILVTKDHSAPQITKHRGARNRNGDYFGPFASVWAVNRTLNALQRAFLLRSCSDSFYDNRTRPCLLYQIKRCSAPCTGEISEPDYAALVRETHDFLTGKSRAVRERLAQEMTHAADLMEFERAARLRDRIAALSAIQGAQGVNPKTVDEADVFAVVEQAGQFCIEAFFFRAYQNWGNRAYFPRADKSLSPAEVLDAFLAQFYADKPPPHLILTSHDIENRAVLEQALRERCGEKIEIAAPRRGEKKELVEHAAQNGREALSRRLSESASQEQLLGALASTFGLSAPPRRIEVYDNSHIMGTNAVGAMIVAGAEGFMKSHYRTFNIKSETLTPGDDYGMMSEVLRRRFARLVKDEAGQILTSQILTSQASTSLDSPPDHPVVADLDLESEPQDDPDERQEAFPQRPDLILIDGGQGQFDAARAILAELGVSGVTVAAIAKGADRNAGRETFFVVGREPFRLPPRDPALYFVQRLRDEAHRFAIGTHRARRKKDFTKSPLDEIAGVGPARKRALLHAFGTAKAISRAALPDLEKVPGVNAAVARLVYDFFHEGRE
ncbi:excinuclease ABC subunit UvrC [Methylocapsa palsarum]|uniref:UvrABC system protein C n=1 Tax=Methylocapsa palsarum TaxID=1612308 RepID=A0A1I3XEZ8_9HYPH|nr:excinuclease ABC subunit UvrC [Methylocapsa palsarum]SFK17929.1 excinuclease ABC subunit C [Methylocapsa palsarum]